MTLAAHGRVAKKGEIVWVITVWDAPSLRLTSTGSASLAECKEGQWAAGAAGRAVGLGQGGAEVGVGSAWLTRAASRTAWQGLAEGSVGGAGRGHGTMPMLTKRER